MRQNSVDLSSLRPGCPGDLTPYTEAIGAIINFPYPDFFTRFFQATMATAYCTLNEEWRWRISSFIKSRGGRAKASSGYSIEEPSELWREFSQKFVARRYEGRPTVILMSHDVDYKTCYQQVAHIANEERSRGVVACYNFLLDAGYHIDKALLKDLIDMGHEVGLHGVTYDLRLAYRSYERIAARLRDGKDRLEDLLGEEIRGFRNHSLLYSSPLTFAVHAAGFSYQSGVYHYGNPDGYKEYFCWPFRYTDMNMWEIPVSLPQDTALFRVSSSNDDEAQSVMKDILDLIGACGGVACINHHPTIVMEHQPYFHDLLDDIMARDALVTTPHRVTGILEKMESNLKTD